MVSWHRSAAFVRGELKEFFHGLPCQDSHTETVSRSAVQPWAADIATDGKMSSAWRKGRNLAWQDYQNTMADNW